jgi:multidrug efflux pump subunit AcrA (membrane-fusion protein)
MFVYEVKMKITPYILGLAAVAAVVFVRFHLTSMNTARVMAVTKAISEVDPTYGQPVNANGYSDAMKREQRLREVENKVAKRRAEIMRKYARRESELRTDADKRQQGYLAEERAAEAKYKAEYENTNTRLSSRDESNRRKDVSQKYTADIQQMHKEHSYAGRDLQYALDHLNRQKRAELEDLKKLEAKWEKEAAEGKASSVQQADTQTPPLNVITGIVSIGDNSNIFINGQVVHLGESIGGVKVVGITRDFAEFEKNGTRWSQRIDEPANSAWK